MIPLAVVSGSTGGIGSVVAKHLWSLGWSLLCLGHTPAKMDRLQEWFLDHTRPEQTAGFLCINLASDAFYWHLNNVLMPHAEDIKLLVVCHGAAPQPESILTQGTSIYDAVMANDVRGALKLCQTVGQYMVQQREGSVVLVSSLHAHTTYPLRLPYATAKAAVVAMARSLAVEWGQYNVRVNSISPWQVSGNRSEMVATKEQEESGENTMELWKQRSPMRRLVTPDDIAKTVVWLTECESVSGQDIRLDCGVSGSMWHQGF